MSRVNLRNREPSRDGLITLFPATQPSKRKKKPSKQQYQVKPSKKLVRIQNTDNLCTGFTYYTNKIFDRELSPKEILDLRGGRKIQTIYVRELCDWLGEYSENGFTLADVKNIESLLDIQIIVICAENFNSVIYKRNVV